MIKRFIFERVSENIITKPWIDRMVASEARLKIIQLERERDEARQQYDDLATEHMLAVNKICGERDDALNQITGWENKWKAAVEIAAIAENDVSNLQDQVDLAMKVIKRLEANKP